MLVSVLIIGSLVQSAAVPLQEHMACGIQLLQAFKNSINKHDHYNLGKRVSQTERCEQHAEMCPCNCFQLESFEKVWQCYQQE